MGVISQAMGVISQAVGVVSQVDCEVQLEVKCRLLFGQQLMVVGSSEEMGGWNLEEALVLDWNPGHLWRGVVSMHAKSPLEYKFLIVNGWDRSIHWQPGDNHKLSAADQRCSRRHIIHQVRNVGP
jgi:hypothetical protein